MPTIRQLPSSQSRIGLAYNVILAVSCEASTLDRFESKMPRLFAFLRAINAGPGRIVKMNVLRNAFESLGFVRAATFLGSGNVVFETRAKDTVALERKIERTVRQAVGYPVSCSLGPRQS